MQFEITSGEVFLTDPCYQQEKTGEPDYAIKTPAKNGTWFADIKISDEGQFGERVKELSARHTDHLLTDAWIPLKGDVCVDSGQAGIFDVGQYPVGRCGKYDDKSSFYGQVCRITLSEEQFGVVEFGCVSSSGFGDGNYEAYAGYDDDDNEVVSLRIVFIEDNEDDEEEED